MTRRKFLLKPRLPLTPHNIPVTTWPDVNRGFYLEYRKWLLDSGYSASALNLYGLAARAVFSVVGKLYWQIDLNADLRAVRDYILSYYDSLGTIATYFKGVAKFEEYLRLRCHRPKPEKPIHWEYYVGPLPTCMAEDVRAYIAHCRRNWPKDKQHECTQDTLSTLTRSLRWMAAENELKGYADLTPQLWFAYVDVRLEEGIKPITLNDELLALKIWLRFVAEQDRPVCQRLLLVDKLEEGNRLPRDVPVERLRDLLTVIESTTTASHGAIRRLGLMDRAWFLLMLHSGFRTGEIRRLRLSDVDWENRRVKIEQSKGLKDRLLPLSAPTVVALQAYLQVRGPADALPDNLFIYAHKPLSQSYCGCRLETYGKSAGIRVTPHQLRHSCATLLLNAGAPVLTVQAILGHRHVDSTLGYARLYDGTLAADYYRAMMQVEQCLALPEDEAAEPMGWGELLALADSLRGGVLNETQLETVRTLRAGISALAMREAGMKLLKGEAPVLDEVAV